MRIVSVLFTLLVMCAVVGCGEESEQILQPASDEAVPAGPPLPANWHALKQSEKNQRILQAAIDDYGENVGKSCKVWVQEVLLRASHGHVVIPLNTKRGDGWKHDPKGRVIRYRYNASPALLNTRPGHIVQMQWKADDDSAYNRHTAIVLAVLPNGVIFIESNYDSTPEDEADAVVDIRFVSEETFNEQVQAFSVYYIQ